VDKLSGLEHPPHLVSRGHTPFVTSTLHPDDTGIVDIGLAHSIRNRHDQDDPVTDGDILGARIDSRSDIRGRGVADQLVESPHGGHVQLMDAPVIGNSNENFTSAGVRKSRNLSRKGHRVRDVFLELMPTVFSASDRF
jgi:hypothetical protein